MSYLYAQADFVTRALWRTAHGLANEIQRSYYNRHYDPNFYSPIIYICDAYIFIDI